MADTSRPLPSRRTRGRVYAIPTEHGTWTWWIGPLLIGMAAGGHPGWTFVSLTVAVLAAFLFHQPAQIAVKALSGRRPRSDLAPALRWCAIYAFVAALGAACLWQTGNVRVLALAVPGIPVFLWHLALVARRAERRQMATEILAAGVLALAAPAAYWVSGGAEYPQPWALWALTWLQSAAAIANVYLRLRQRAWSGVPALGARLRAGQLTLLLHLAGAGAAVFFAAVGLVPWSVLIAFGIVLADAIDTTLRPMLGARPKQIGVRQLVVWMLFVAAFALAYA